MTFVEFRTYVNRISIGKHLPTAIYLHIDAVKIIPIELRIFIYQTIEILNIGTDWNVIKLFKRDFKLSLLWYPEYFTESYPSLKTSTAIDLLKGSVREASYKDSNNPPILHRKETLLPKGHSEIDKFTAITREGEEIGLYKNARRIGFKKDWERLVRQKGFSLDNGHLRPIEICNESQFKTIDSSKNEIERHKTALSRDKLSVPMQLLARRDYLNGEYSVLDYGCGRGDDVRELVAHGLNASGWDPVFNTDGNLKKCDIVNLGYVINVIDDKEERRLTLSNAYKYCKKLLVVSAMLGNENIISRYSTYKDGVITQKNTFQKYYVQSELKHYIEQTLNTNAIAAGPGIFFVFKDEIEEQNYLLSRQQSRYTWRQYTQRPSQAIDEYAAASIVSRHEQLFTDFWETLLDLGRLPGCDEFEYLGQLRRTAGSLPKALDAALCYFNKVEFEEAKNRRRDDLLVYFALGFFSKRSAYGRMPEGLQRDIKTFFGNYSNAREYGKSLLFSMAETEVIHDACRKAHAILPISQLNEDHDLIFHRRYLNICPKELRVYVGCAIQLYGDIDNVDLIKAHITSGKVSLMIYDNWDKDIPLLTERIKINLREQDINFFDYIGEYSPQPLYDKSLYVN